MTQFLMGLAAGAAAGWLCFRVWRREARHLEDEKHLLVQEKQIVLEFMHNMVEAIGEGVDRRELFRRMVHAAILSTGALSACVFGKTAGNRLRTVTVEGLFPPLRPLPEEPEMENTTRSKFIGQVMAAAEFEFGEGLIGEAAAAKKGFFIQDARSDARVVQHGDPALAVRSLIIVPVYFRDVILGVLAVANPSDGTVFDETDFSLVQSMAEQAGLAIHNSDLMELQIEQNKIDTELSLAGSIQSLLLPKKFPPFPGFEIDAYYQPARKIGGDLYDVFPLSGTKAALAIADVSGKGVPASLLMTVCQTNLRHFAKMYKSPARVLGEVNRVMSEEMRKDMFVTVIYAVLDTVSGELTLARAGHELPLHFHKSARNGLWKAVSIGSEGMALGMVPSNLFNTVISETTVSLLPGDIIVFYTDGVTEAANAEGNEFTAARLADTVKSLRDRSAREINQGVMENINRFTGGAAFEDDLTLMTVKHLQREEQADCR